MAGFVTSPPRPAPRMVDVDAPPLRLPLEPFDCNEAATLLRVEGALVGRNRGLYAVGGAVDLGLAVAASVSHMARQVARLGESRLAFPASVGARNLLEVCDQEGVPVVKTHVQQRTPNLVIVGREVGQDKVSVRLNRVSRNTLLEMVFKQG